jgi:hypothetical protein
MKVSESARRLGLMAGLVGGSLALLAAYTHTVVQMAQRSKTESVQRLIIPASAPGIDLLHTVKTAAAPDITGEWHPSRTRVVDLGDGTIMEFAGEMSDDDMARAIWGMNMPHPPSEVVSDPAPVSTAFWAFFLIPALPLLGFLLLGTMRLVSLLGSKINASHPRVIENQTLEAV